MQSSKLSNLIIVVIFGLTMFFSTGWIAYNASGIMKDNTENSTRVVAALVANVVDNTLIRPITVAETISKDPTTIDLLSVDTPEQAEAESCMAAQYLTSLRDGFGYSIVFAIDDRTKAYFTPDGMTRYIDPQNNPADTWYTAAVESNKQYLLDVDVDEAANWSLSIFVNAPVYDSRGTLLGLTGVGVDITELQRVFERYERIYDIKIDIINDQGLIQVDSDSKRIEKESIHIDNISNYKTGQTYYEILPEGSRTITYIEDLGWFLIVQSNTNVSGQITNFWLPGLICSSIGLALIVAVYLVSSRKERQNAAPQKQ